MNNYSPISVTRRAILAEKLTANELEVACRGLEKLGLLCDKKIYKGSPPLLPCEELATVRGLGYLIAAYPGLASKYLDSDNEFLLRALLKENRWKMYLAEGFDPHAMISLALYGIGNRPPGSVLAHAVKAMFTIWLRPSIGNLNKCQPKLVAQAICTRLFGQTWWDLRSPDEALAKIVHNERPEFCTKVPLLEGYQAHQAQDLPLNLDQCASSASI
jgi:hypothetical protein